MFQQMAAGAVGVLALQSFPGFQLDHRSAGLPSDRSGRDAEGLYSRLFFLVVLQYVSRPAWLSLSSS